MVGEADGWLAIGLVHGLVGTGALTSLVMSTSPTIGSAVYRCVVLRFAWPADAGAAGAVRRPPGRGEQQLASRLEGSSEA
jgi:hypothetical protein